MLLFCFVLFLMAVCDSVFSSQPGLGVDVKTKLKPFLSNISRSVFRLLRFGAHSRLEF